MLGKIFFGLICFLLIFGCTGETQTNGTPGNTNGLLGNNSGTGIPFESEFYKNAMEQNTELQEKTYSMDLIEEAYENKELSKDEFFVQSAYAAFEPELLNSNYSGEEPEISPDGFLWRLTNEFDSLSNESQEKLEKYILPPSDSKSFWHSDEIVIEAMEEKKDIIYFSIMQNKHPLTGLEYHIEYPTGMEAKKIITENAFTKAFNMYSFNVVLNEPKDWVHIYIQDLPKYDGLAYYNNELGAKRCILVINKTLDERKMKTTVAHELFHCFQFYVPLKYTGDEMWSMEATATWSEEYVYPTENTEHEYDAEFFGKLNKDMFNKKGDREYGSYLWFYYLYQNEGKAPDFMRDFLMHTSMEGTKTAITELSEFDSKFHEYALWNYNTAPFKYYQDTAGKPSSTPHDASYEFSFPSPEAKFDQKIDVAKGGMKYYEFALIDSIKRIEFDLTSFNPIPNAQTGIQMIYEIGGQKFYMDVSDRDKIEFCRTRPNEKVDSVLFIVSNSDLDSKLVGPMKIDTTGECAPMWSGYVKMNWTDSRGYDWSEITGDPTVETRNRTGDYISNEKLIYDKEEDEWLLKSRTASLRESDISLISYGHDCGNETKYDADWVNGNHNENHDTLSKPMYVIRSDLLTRINKNNDGKYELNLGMSLDNTKYSSMLSYTRKPCPLDGAFFPPPYYKPQALSSQGEGREPQPNDVPVLTLSPDGKHLFGEGTANFQSGDEIINVSFVANFYYG
ncbi:MAG: DUF6055 domain-containing protein [Candidatus Diapherotrites archaeon]